MTVSWELEVALQMPLLPLMSNSPWLFHQSTMWPSYSLQAFIRNYYMLDKITSLRTWGRIPTERSAVRKVVRSCMTSKKQRAATMEQMMSTLPAFRTTAYEPCFTYTGVDYFGPLNVKKGRSVVKRWGAIFKCMNSRAIHLELATSLEADCFINVFRRFVNRRGPPKFMYSDNETNFLGAEREIRQAIENWNQCQIRDELPVERMSVGVSAT